MSLFQELFTNLISLISDKSEKINYSNNQNQSQDISDKNSQKINHIYYVNLTAFINALK